MRWPADDILRALHDEYESVDFMAYRLHGERYYFLLVRVTLEPVAAHAHFTGTAPRRVLEEAAFRLL